MYRVMLVEDEQRVLEAILHVTKWEELGFQQPVGCRDGRDAIAAIESGFRPDVLITDICMPFVDGLKLTEYVGQHLPGTVVVVLSGHEEFGYAQKAVRLGVFDYILKPVTPGQINKLMERLKEELDARRLQSAEDSMEIVATHFLNRLLVSQMDPDVIRQKQLLHKFSFEGTHHVAAVLDLDLPAPADMDGSSFLELMRYGLHNIVAELGGQWKNCLVFQGGDGTTKLIVSGSDAQNAEEAAYQAASGLAKAAGSVLDIGVSAGIGGAVERLENLRQSHSQALAALGRRFFHGENSVICKRDIEEQRGMELDYAVFEERFRQALQKMDRSEAGAAVEDFFAGMACACPPYERCYLYCQRLVTAALDLLSELVGGQYVLALAQEWEQCNLYTVTNLPRLRDLVAGMAEKALDLLEMSRSDFASVQAHKAEQYIKEHFCDPALSLAAVTEHLSISTSYFSSIFKSRTGSTFVEYLTQLRMEKAKQILAFTDRKTYEAAEDVGFSDPHYFSAAFKRVTGMTPKEYRARCKQEGMSVD